MCAEFTGAVRRDTHEDREAEAETEKANAAGMHPIEKLGIQPRVG